MAHYARDARSKLRDSLTKLGYSAYLIESQRCVEFTKNGVTQKIKATVSPGGYGSDNLDCEAVSTHNFMSHSSVRFADPYSVCTMIGRMFTDPDCKAKIDAIDKIISGLSTWMQECGFSTSINSKNCMIINLNNASGGWGYRGIRKHIKLQPTTSTETYEMHVSDDEYNPPRVIAVNLNLDETTSELIEMIPMLKSMKSGVYTTDFSEVPMVSADDRIYHGTILSARILDVVSVDGYKINKADTLNPNANPFFKIDVQIIGEHNTQVIVTDGDKWARVYNGSEDVILPTTDFILTLEDKDLIGKAIQHQIVNTENQNDAETSSKTT